ncbi:hypothetical protein Hanom_Chr16g01421821 [Helianthus anomalus]
MWRRITLLIKLLNHQRKSQVAEPSPVLGVLYITFKYLVGRLGYVVGKKGFRSTRLETSSFSLRLMIVEMIGERVVVVTHGGVIRALHEWASLGTGHRAGRILNSQCITLIGSRQIGHQIMGGCQSSEWSRVLRLGFWWRSNFRLGFFVHVHLLTC